MIADDAPAGRAVFDKIFDRIAEIQKSREAMAKGEAVERRRGRC